MNTELRIEKDLDKQQREDIMREARSIKHDFRRWGFHLQILPTNPCKGWAKMTLKQIYQPETYDLYLNGECVKADMNIFELRKNHLEAKRYKHDHGVRRLRENIEDIFK